MTLSFRRAQTPRAATPASPALHTGGGHDGQSVVDVAELELELARGLAQLQQQQELHGQVGFLLAL